jgi:hypothetical protein
MSETTANAANDEQHRDCERCGRDRPTDTERFAITASDFSDSTAAYEKALLCRDCWQNARDELRRSFA